MKPLVLGRPVAAQVWLRWTPIGPGAPVQAAADPIVIQITAGGNDLGLDREVPGAFHLAEIRRTTGPHQGLEALLAAGAHDLDLQIPAAGGPPAVICGATRCQRARVLSLKHRETARRLRQAPSYYPPVLHELKAVPS